MVCRIVKNKPRITGIKGIFEETSEIRTILVYDEDCSRGSPGNFAMIWVPGIGEVPMSLSIMDRNGICGITVKPIGDTTKKLCSKKIGEKIGIRGPYGNCFNIVKGSTLIVGGGTGLGPLFPLCKSLIETGSSITFILAGKNKKELIFLNDVSKLLHNSKHRLLISTDDGSLGAKGFASDCVSDILSKEKFDMIYTCGPEIMIKKIFKLTEEHELPLEASLERYMKCGFGICGSCSMGEYLVCIDGPVFNSKKIRSISNDFGISKKDEAGRKIKIIK